MMKYLLCIPHSLYFSWVCWFGGKIDGGKWYLLWTLTVRGDVELTNLEIVTMRKGMASIMFRLTKENNQ